MKGTFHFDHNDHPFDYYVHNSGKSHRYVNGYCNSLAFVPKYVTNVTCTNYTEDFPGLQILLLTDPSIKVKN